MTEEKQKEIFAKNLNYYIEKNQKQQVDVAKDLGINPTTLNMWCKGNSIPNSGKIRKLADYFMIGVTDLVDEKEKYQQNVEVSDVVMSIIMNDKRFLKILKAYYEMSLGEKKLFCDFFEKFIL